jgi:hypothetical protein
MKTTQKMLGPHGADRRYRISLWCLVAATCCAMASLLGCLLVLAMSPQDNGWEGLEDLIRTILWAFGGLILAGGFALAALGYGIACARQRKRALFWVVPLWLAAAFGLAAGIVQLTLLADEKLRFIPGGKQDDVITLLGIWLGFVSLLTLGYWITAVVIELRFRLFPWWAIPLWAIILTSALILLG